MPFDISITVDADRQVQALAARDRVILETAIASRLRHNPSTQTKAIKRLRSNPLVDFELRAGDLRVLDNVNVESQEVVILLVGRKVGNKLIVEGEEFHGHKDDPTEPPGNGPRKDAQ